MELSAVFGFAAVALAMIVVPGPDWAYVLAAGTRNHVVWPVVSGIAIGYALITAVVALGVGPLIATRPLALTALTAAGALYLMYLGIRVLRSRPEPLQATEAAAASSLHFLARGVGVSALNPKGLLIFLSILPQFAHPTVTWPLPLQLTALGGVFILICAAVYFPLGHVADRVLGARPRIAQITTRVAGAAMIIVGTILLAERLIPTF
ncbi:MULTISPECIES: LysE family translocator [unclassified Streptomyces]|uniref:LysE family translocator n=1 Tax=unclassified Streptomyces TaxID=2593676 RepID=UPI0015E168C7|nr:MULTISPECIES: LysE family translocator [unclassified Streptomyces]